MADDDQEPDNNEPRPMGQDEIDGLFRQMKGADDAANSADEPAAADDGEKKVDDANQEALGQSEIDALLDELNDDAPAGSTTPVASELAAEEGAVAASDAQEDGPLGQSAIDDLLAEMGGADAAEKPDIDHAVAEAPSDENLGQNAVDALLGEMQADSGAAATLLGDPESSDDEQKDDGPLAQNEIDDLLKQLGASDPTSSTFDDSGPETEESEDADDSIVSQNEIDKLLSEMGINEGSSAQAGPAPLLSTEQIVGIVKNQEETGVPDDDAEIMIDQDDINSLLREMSQATGVPDQEEIDAALNNNEDDIEALLAEASSPMAASDAVKGSLVFGQGPSSQQAVSIQNAAVMAPDELRGTKYLLVMAVFFLAMCAVTMGFVVSSINSLAIELEQNRVSEIKPLDDFQENIVFAQKMLESEEELEVIQGVKFVSQLKENYDKDSEKIISLALVMASHYRGKGAYSKAQKEFMVMTERRGVLYDYPQYYLDYADTLFLIGEQHYDEAVNIIYRLLANEQYYVEAGENESRGEGEIEENKKIIQEAYLMLGRIYTAQLELSSGRGGV